MPKFGTVVDIKYAAVNPVGKYVIVQLQRKDSSGKAAQSLTFYQHGYLEIMILAWLPGNYI